MLELAALLFTVSCVACLSLARAPLYASAGAAAFVAAAAVAIACFGALIGGVVVGVLLMSVASLLVLVLSPRPRLARPVALVAGALGVALSGLSGVLS